METLRKLFLMLALCLLGAASCTKDEDELNKPEIITGTQITVDAKANDDVTLGNLDATLRAAFGGDYTQSLSPLKLKVRGSINAADFSSLNHFAEVDLSECDIVGEIILGQVVLDAGSGDNTSTETVVGNAIPTAAFKSNTKLKQIILPASVEAIGNLAFNSCSVLSSVVIDSASGGVQTICKSAFAGCGQLVNINSIFGEDTQEIRATAFEGCGSITEIYLDGGLAPLTIAEAAFSDCAELIEVSLPESVMALGDGVFASCPKLAIFTSYIKGNVPLASKNLLPEQFLAEQSSAKAVAISEDMLLYSKAGWGIYNLQSDDPNDWKTVYANAEEDMGLQQALMSKFGTDFDKKSDLKVKVVGSISAADFVDFLTAFSHIDLSDVRVVGDVVVSSQFAQGGGVAMETVDGNAIPAEAFMNSNVKFLAVPRSITRIGDAAFRGNENLAKVDLTTDVPLHIGHSAFRDVKNLGTEVDGGFFTRTSEGSKTLIIPNNVSKIGDYAFDGNEEIGIIRFDVAGDGSILVPEIAANTFPARFKTGENGATVQVPIAQAGLYNTIEWQSYIRQTYTGLSEEGTPEGLTEIDEDSVTCIANTEANSNSTIEPAIKQALIDVFGDDYVKQKRVVLSGTLCYADFRELKTFEEIDMAEVDIVGEIPVSKLSNTAFNYATRTAIPTAAFCGIGTNNNPLARGNTALKKITLPRSVRELGTYALGHCVNLKTVIFPEEMLIEKFNTLTFAFSGIEKFVIGTTEDEGIINYPTKFTNIPQQSFDGCSMLRTVDLSAHKGLRQIDNFAFRACESLADVKLPLDGSFTTLLNGVFYEAKNLSSIVLPEGLQVLGDNTFAYSGLTSINIPRTVLGSSASGVSNNLEGVFDECNNLVSITFNWGEYTEGEQTVDYPTPLGIFLEETDIDGTIYYPTFPSAFYADGGTRVIAIKDGSESFYDGSWNMLALKSSSDIAFVNDTPGMLADKLDDVYGSAIPTSLTLAGQLNTADFDFLRSLEAIESLDVSRVDLVDGAKISLAGNSSLKVVTLPAELEAIENSAFEGCSALEIVVMPAALTKIGDYAFKGASSLMSLAVPSTVVEIGKGAFEGTSQLDGVSIPDGVSTIADETFKGSGIKTIYIGTNITSIGEQAFAGATRLASVSIPESVVTIGESAFAGATNLASVDIPSTITTGGTTIFNGCTALESVNFANSETGTTQIYEGMFQNAEGLKSISIPAYISSIEARAFSGCVNLTTVKVAWIGEGVPQLSDYDNIFPETAKIQLPTGASEADYSAKGWKNVDQASENTVVSTAGGLEAAIYARWPNFKEMSNRPTDIVVTGSMNGVDFAALQILDYEFVNIDLSDVEIENNIIPASAFESNTVIRSLALPQTIVQIGNSAFQNCTSLRTFNFPASLSVIDEEAFSASGITEVPALRNLTEIYNKAFFDCKSLERVDLSKSEKLVLIENGTTTTQGQQMFQGCSALTSVALPETLNVIPRSMFVNCSKLVEVNIPQSVTVIGTIAFSGCSSLTEIELPAALEVFGYNTTSLLYNTFLNCSKLENIKVNWTKTEQLPTISANTLPTIFKDGGSAFITIPEGVNESVYKAGAVWADYQYKQDGENVVTIPAGTARTLDYIIGVKWPDAADVPSSLVVKGEVSNDHHDILEWQAALDNFGIEHLDLSQLEGLTAIPNSWYDGSTKLRSLTLSDDVTAIGAEAFKGSKLLSSVVMNGVETIGRSAFEGAISIQSMAFPAKVRMIGESSFARSGLKSITTPSYTAATFEIGAMAFDECYSLSEVTLNEGLKSIGEAAFNRCTSLITLIFPATLESIESKAFAGCAKLSQVAAQAWIDANKFPTISSDVFPTQFLRTSSGGFIIKAASVSTISKGWENFSVITEDKYDAIVAAAGSLSKVIAESEALSEGSKIRVLGVINQADFAALKGKYAEIDLSLSTIVNAVDVVDGGVRQDGKAIPLNAFNGDTKLQKIALPAAITKIGEGAFAGASKLTEITNEVGLASLTRIEASAFEGAKILTNDKADDKWFSDLFPSLESIGERAFAQTAFGGTLTLPESLESLENSIFEACIFDNIYLPWTSADAAAELTVSSLPSEYAAGTYNKYLKFAPELALSEEAAKALADAYQATDKGWSNYAFDANTDAESLKLLVQNPIENTQEGATKTLANMIAEKMVDGKQVFEGYDPVTSLVAIDGAVPSKTYEKITISGYMTEADFRAIQCFEEIDMAGVTIVGTVYHTVTLPPSGTTARPATTLSNSSTLPALAFTKVIPTVGETFDIAKVEMSSYEMQITDNPVLKKITLPASVTHIGGAVFYKNTQLKDVVYPAAMQLNRIEGSAFGRTAIERIENLPATLQDIRWAAFTYCAQLVEADFSNITNVNFSLDGLVLSYCTALKKARLPEGYVKNINQTFYGCRALEDFIIPEGTLDIMQNSFRDCVALEEIIIPEGVLEIHQRAFMNCSSLRSIEIPSSTTFNNGTTLQTLQFDGCTSLQRVNVNWINNPPAVSETTFPAQFAAGTGEYSISIPDAADASAYGGNWAEFNLSKRSANTVDSSAGQLGALVAAKWTASSAPEVIYVYGELSAEDFSAFKSLTTVKNIIMSEATIVDGTRVIPAQSFAGMLSLENVSFPSGITGVGEGAFENCSSYQANIEGLSTIGAKAYKNTNTSGDIKIPAAVTAIGAEAFAGCDGISSIIVEWTTAEAIPAVVGNEFPAVFQLGGAKEILAPLGYSPIYNNSWGVHYNISENDPTLVKTTAGGLKAAIEAKFSTDVEAYKTQTIRVVGPIDISVDMVAPSNLPSILGYFKHVDLSGATLEGVSKATNAVTTYEDIIPIRAFCYNRTSIPNTVTETIILPADTKRIAAQSFGYCTALKSVTIAEGGKIEDVNQYAFDKCPALTTIFDLSGTKLIGAEGFDSCSSLTTMDGGEVGVLKLGYLPYTEATPAHGGTTNLGFRNTAFETVMIGEYITGSLHNTTFVYNATSDFAPAQPTLKHFIIENERALTIPDNLFAGQTNLQTVSLPWTTTNIPAATLLTLPTQFVKGSGSAYVILPNYDAATVAAYEAQGWGVYNIGVPPVVEEVNISVSNVSAGALFQAISDKLSEQSKTTEDVISTLTITGELNDADFAALSGLKVENIDMGMANAEGNAIPAQIWLGVKTSGDPIEEAKVAAAYLETIVLPTSVTSLGKNLFFTATKLTDVQWGVADGTATIATGAFRATQISNECAQRMLDKIDGVAVDQIFGNIQTITDLKINSNITELKHYVFETSKNLTTVTITGDMPSVDYRSFPEQFRHYNPYSGLYTAEPRSKITLSAAPTVENTWLYDGTFSFTAGGETITPAAASPKFATEYSDLPPMELNTLRVETAGGLEAALAASTNPAYNLTDTFDNLKVIGALNDADILVLRQYLIKNIDLSEATLEGGVLAGSSWKPNAVDPATPAAGGAVLETFALPSNIAELGLSAFDDCDNLTSVSFPEGLADASIIFNGSVFKNSPKVSQATADEVSRLISGDTYKGQMFRNNTSLTSFTIPAGVSKMENYVISANSIKDIYIYSSEFASSLAATVNKFPSGYTDAAQTGYTVHILKSRESELAEWQAALAATVVADLE